MFSHTEKLLQAELRKREGTHGSSTQVNDYLSEEVKKAI